MSEDELYEAATADEGEEAEWFYLVGQEQGGPVSREQLREMIERRELAVDAYVWREGMADWARAATVEGLTEGLAGAGWTGGIARGGAWEAGIIAQPRPWVRLLARLTDILLHLMVLGLLIGIVMVILDLPPGLPQIEGVPDWVMGLVLLLLMLPLEAFFLATWGTTPGKWLLGTVVRTESGGKAPLGRAFWRTVLVTIKGLGFWIPLVAIFTLIVAQHRLTHQGRTSWDEDCKTQVIHRKFSAVRLVMFILFWALMVWLFSQGMEPVG